MKWLWAQSEMPFCLCMIITHSSSRGEWGCFPTVLMPLCMCECVCDTSENQVDRSHCQAGSKCTEKRGQGRINRSAALFEMTNTCSCQKGTIKNNLHKLYVGWALFDAVFPLAITAMAQLQPYGQPGSGPWGSGIPGWLIKSCCQGHRRPVSDLPHPHHQPPPPPSLLTLSLPPRADPPLWPTVVSTRSQAAATRDRERPPVIIWDNIPRVEVGYVREEKNYVLCCVCVLLFLDVCACAHTWVHACISARILQSIKVNISTFLLEWV